MSETMNQEAAPDISTNSNFPLGLIRGLRNGMPNSGSGNNSGDSDNSGSLSIGNNSFGFNFDSDEMNKISAVPIGSALNSAEGKDDPDDKNSEECADETASTEKKNFDLLTSPKLEVTNSGASQVPPKVEIGPPLPVSSSMEKAQSGSKTSTIGVQGNTQEKEEQSKEKQGAGFSLKTVDVAVSSTLEQPSVVGAKLTEPSQQKSTASHASENRVKFSSSCPGTPATNHGVKDAIVEQTPEQTGIALATAKASSKRSHSSSKKMDENELGSEAGYNSDDEATESANKSENKQAAAGEKNNRKQKRTTDNKREERNAREKDRSLRISQQIDDLRSLLSSGGVIVPKGTKSSVLTEASNYIRMLQQHQYRSEIDRHQLVQQIQMIGSGALGPQAADAVRHAAAQNGVWCLGNFGGVPPQSAMTPVQKVPSVQEGTTPAATTQQQPVDVRQIKKVEEHDYRHLFSSSSIAMAIASMGGAFIDCNKLFCQLSEFSKQELCSMTIFNLTAKSDLQSAFDRISSMIAPPPSGGQEQASSPPILLRGAMKEREDLGLNISLVRGDDGVLKCFCVTLVKDIPPAFSNGRPTVASFESLKQTFVSNGPLELAQKPGVPDEAVTSPAYTAG